MLLFLSCMVANGGIAVTVCTVEVVEGEGSCIYYTSGLRKFEFTVMFKLLLLCVPHVRELFSTSSCLPFLVRVFSVGSVLLY